MAGRPWTRMHLGDFVTLQRGHDLPDAIRRPGNTPILGSFGVTGWHDEAIIAGPGVTVGRSGASLGVVSYSTVAYWPLNTALYVTDFHGNDQHFAYYFLKQFDFRAYNSGSAQPSLNRNFIHPIPVDVPPLPEQRVIAHILGTLDDKIELNRRMNETLEEMARALFKSWFVNFDPVRAKMEGRWRSGESLPGLPAEHYDLFPDRLVPSELGDIPDGWEVRMLGDVLDLSYGKALREQERRSGPFPVYGSNGQVGWHDEKLVDGPGIIVGRKGNPGFVKWSPAAFYPIDTTFYVVPRDEELGLHFLFQALEVQDLPSIAADSAVPGLNRNLAYMNRQVWPPRQVAEQFESHAHDMSARRHRLEQESSTLITLRDALLPKLVSGGIRVGALQKIIETVYQEV